MHHHAWLWIIIPLAIVLVIVGTTQHNTATYSTPNGVVTAPFIVRK